MTEHSILSPSSFPRLVACPGSRKFEAMFPREESEAAAEGILAHEYCSFFLKAAYDKNYNVVNLSLKPNLLLFTDEMGNAAEIYYGHINEKLGLEGCKIHVSDLYKKLHTEERIDIPYLHPECFGTPDCWYYDEEKNEIHVWDFKYGFKPVEAIENWQLIGYACGIVRNVIFYNINKCDDDYSFDIIFDLTKLNDQKIKNLIINLHIVQPRARHSEGPIRTWSLTNDALCGYIDILKAQIEKSFLENPPLAVGAHCTYCKAKSICPALKKESKMIVDKELNTDRELPRLSEFTTEEDFKKIFGDPLDCKAVEDTQRKSAFGIISNTASSCKPDIDWSKPVLLDNAKVEYSTEKKDINPNFVAHFEKSIDPECKIINTSQWDTTEEEWKKRAHELILNVVNEKIDSGEIEQEEQDITLEQSILDTRRSIEILKIRLETLEKQALDEIQSGKKVSGFIAKKVWGRLGWTIPAKDVQLLGDELGLNLVKPAKTEVITPLQAIKLAKKDEAIKERIKSLSSCKFNGFKLVAEDEVSDDDEVNFDDL